METGGDRSATRSPLTWALLVVLALLGAGGCAPAEHDDVAGDGGRAELSTDERILEADVCKVYEEVFEAGPVETPEEFEEFFRHAESLRRLVPDEFAATVDDLVAYHEFMQGVFARFDGDPSRVFGWLLDNPNEDAAVVALASAARAESDLARVAHRDCGTPDPAFLLACRYTDFDDGSGMTVVDNDLQKTIDAVLQGLPAGTTFATERAGGTNGVEVAYLSPEGTTIRVDHYTRPQGSLNPQDSVACAADQTPRRV